jgi:hypothetical protein
MHYREESVAQAPQPVTTPLTRLTDVIVKHGNFWGELVSFKCEVLKVTLLALPTNQVFIRRDDLRQFEASEMDALLWLRRLEQVGIQ